jgi:hypothetical protein
MRRLSGGSSETGGLKHSKVRETGPNLNNFGNHHFSRRRNCKLKRFLEVAAIDVIVGFLGGSLTGGLFAHGAPASARSMLHAAPVQPSVR